jgi:hypothetical protein
MMPMIAHPSVQSGFSIALEEKALSVLRGIPAWRRSHPHPVETTTPRDNQTVKRTNEKPLVFGYHSARTSIPAQQTIDNRANLADFADREGYALADIFSEPSQEPSVALQALFQSAERRQVTAVIVPGMADLGTTPPVQQVTCDRLEYAGIHLLVLPDDAALADAPIEPL